METLDTTRNWALYNHIYTFFVNGGTLQEAVTKWTQEIQIVKYFYTYHLNQK